MAGLSNAGFTIKRIAEIKTDLETEARDIFQDIVPIGDAVDTSESSLIGRFIGLASLPSSDLWEAAQDVYSAFNAATATGNALDNIVSLLGLTRKEAAGSTARVLLEGSNGVTITAGSVVASTSSSKQYELTEAVTLTESGCAGIGINIPSPANSTAYTLRYSFDTVNWATVTVTSAGSGATEATILTQIKTAIDTSHSTYFTTHYVGSRLFIKQVDVYKPTYFDLTVTSNITATKVMVIGEFQCTETGAISDAAGTLTSIQTPILNWDSATNPDSVNEGNARETDYELRARFLLSKSSLAVGHVDAILTAVRAVDGVVEAQMYENNTSSTDSNGIPANSFMVVADGGLDSDVAAAINDNRPIGIGMDGNTSVLVKTASGNSSTVLFERPTDTALYIDIDITYTNGTLSAISADIKQALIDYIDTLGIGEDVIYSRLYTPINSVAGFQVNTLEIGTSPSPTGTSNIAIAFNKKAALSASNITVTIT